MKLRSNSFQSFFKYYCQVIFFFGSLVHKNNLLVQYPEATSLIKELPGSLDDKCFKPQAHMLIEKYFSLKKETSRELFIESLVDLSVKLAVSFRNYFLFYL